MSRRSERADCCLRLARDKAESLHQACFKSEVEARSPIDVRHRARSAHGLRQNDIGVSLCIKIELVVSIYAMKFYMRKFWFNGLWRLAVFLTIRREIGIRESGARDWRRRGVSAGSLTLQFSTGQREDLS